MVTKQNKALTRLPGSNMAGGESKINKEKSETKKFFKDHPEIKDFINDFYDYNFKEIMLGLNAADAIIEEVKKEYNIELPKYYIKYF